MKHPAFPGLCLAVSLCALTFNINAANSDLAADEFEFIGMPPLIITASHIAQAEENTIASVTVISKEDIELIGAKSVADLLQTVPGINISKTGGKGQVHSLFLRGTDSEQTLILLNGQRISSATAGTTAFNLIPVEHIARIEVIRGNRSSIHGSDAIGGVINIITRSATDAPHSSAGISVGDEHSEGYRFSHNGPSGKNSLYSLALSHFTTNGFDVVDDNNQADDDNYRNSSGSLSFKHNFSDAISSTVFGIVSEGNTAFDSSYRGDESDFENYNVNINSQYSNDNFTTNLIAGESRDKMTTFGNGVLRSDGDIFSTIRSSVDWNNVFNTHFITPSTQSQLAFGLSWYKDDVSGSTITYNEQSRANKSAYLELKMDNNNNHAEAGYRLEDNQQFGDFDSFNIGFQHDFCLCFKAGAAYATGFRAPTFNELYYPGFSNPDLLPEKSKSTEINFKGFTDGADWFITVYNTKIRQAISSSTNIGKLEIDGIETGLEFTWAATQQRLTAEWTKAENRDRNSPNFRNSPILIPAKALKWNISKQWYKLTINGSLNYQGERYTNATNTEQIGSFSTLDLNVRYHLHKQLKLGIRIENVFDKEYIATAAFGDFFNAQRRIAYLDLDYSFN